MKKTSEKFPTYVLAFHATDPKVDGEGNIVVNSEAEIEPAFERMVALIKRRQFYPHIEEMYLRNLRRPLLQRFGTIGEFTAQEQVLPFFNVELATEYERIHGFMDLCGYRPTIRNTPQSLPEYLKEHRIKMPTPPSV
jgi:hypothetical protein